MNNKNDTNNNIANTNSTVVPNKDSNEMSVEERKNKNRNIYKEVHKEKKEEKFQHLLDANKCGNCWFLAKNCICSQLNKIELVHEYLICFHPTEWTRGTNTGKLIVLSENLPKNPTPLEKFGDDKITTSDSVYNNTSINTHSKLFVLGGEDEDKFEELLKNRNPETTFILYPSKNSINIQEYLSTFKYNVETNLNPKDKEVSTENIIENIEKLEISEDNNNNDDIITIRETLEKIKVTNQNTNNQIKFTVIIVDGTWRQAKSLHKRLPKDIKRIHLEFGLFKFRSLYNALRTQPQVDRISTLEASILSMKYLLESNESIENLIKSLEILVKNMVIQSQKQNKDAITNWIGNKNGNRNVFNTTSTSTSSTHKKEEENEKE